MLDKFTEDNYVVVETYKKEGGELVFLEPSQELKECLEKCLGKGVEY